MKISQSAFDLIVREEVTSEAYYKRHYTHPEWPGGMSGVTVGIGYDLGYATPDKIKADWHEHVDNDMLTIMVHCSGLRGTTARGELDLVKPAINVPWVAAIAVFSNRDIPHWTAAVIAAIPGAAKLSPTCLGVIVSIAYNRGASFNLSGDRYAEMRAIKEHVEAGQLDRVASDIRSMKRLWPNMKGLRDRRDHEAALWERGLTINEPEAKDIAPTLPAPARDLPVGEGSPARTKPPATSTAQNTTTGAIVVGGAVATQQAHAHGLISTDFAIFLGFLAVLAGITAWWLWYRNRNPK